VAEAEIAAAAAVAVAAETAGELHPFTLAGTIDARKALHVHLKSPSAPVAQLDRAPASGAVG
jgi:hypothetical protein